MSDNAHDFNLAKNKEKRYVIISSAHKQKGPKNYVIWTVQTISVLNAEVSRKFEPIKSSYTQLMILFEVL